MVLEDLGRGRRSSFHAVHDDDVGAGLGSQLHVVVDPSRAELHEDRHLPVGGLTQLLDLDDHVVRSEPVRVAGRAPLVDTGRKLPGRSDLCRDLGSQQHAARSRLGALPHRQLDPVGRAQMMDVEPVPARQHLVDEDPRVLALGWQHPSVPGGGRAARLPGTAGEGDLGVGGERAPAHARDHDGDVQLDRPLGVPGAEDRPGIAALAVPLQRDPCERAGQEGQIVERWQRPRPDRPEATEPVAPQLRLDLDIFHHLRRKDPARPEGAQNAAFHASSSFLS